MHKALALLQETPVQEKKSKTPTIAIDPNRCIELALYDRTTTAKAAARLYKLYKRRMSALETEMNALKTSLRLSGLMLLEEAAESGKYYTRVDVCGVPVSRANKFKPVPYERNKLMDAVGETEYRLMFNEDAYIQFTDIDQMREFVALCGEAGVEICGEVTETVTGNPKLNEHIVKTQRHLDKPVVDLLKRCAVDQQLRVGGK